MKVLMHKNPHDHEGYIDELINTLTVEECDEVLQIEGYQNQTQKILEIAKRHEIHQQTPEKKT